jgi:hypothetical protein
VIANPEAVNDPEDEREIFVAAWCAHPDLIPDEKIMAVPEPEEEHDGGPLLFLRPHVIIHDEVPALRYLVRLRIVEFQDWHTPPPSSDDELGYGNDDSDDDSGDSNYNGYHPGFVASGGAGARPRTSRFAGPDEPRLGPGHGPSFRARESRQPIVVGDFCCPVVSPSGAMPCRAAGSGFPATRGTRVEESMEDQFDFEPVLAGSPSSVKMPVVDPMVDEAALFTPRTQHQAADDSDTPHSIDIWPRAGRSARAAASGIVGGALAQDAELCWAGA